jgi:hypothetical protein
MVLAPHQKGSSPILGFDLCAAFSKLMDGFYLLTAAVHLCGLQVKRRDGKQIQVKM